MKKLGRLVSPSMSSRVVAEIAAEEGGAGEGGEQGGRRIEGAKIEGRVLNGRDRIQRVGRIQEGVRGEGGGRGGVDSERERNRVNSVEPVPLRPSVASMSKKSFEVYHFVCAGMNNVNE